MRRKYTGVRPTHGRNAAVRSISMQPEGWDYVHQRVSDMSPRIKDRSHYFQLLVHYERKNPNLLEMILAGS